MVSVVYLSLSISREEYLKLYAGTAKSVIARSVDGRKIRFPASILRPYVSHNGVQGQFAIYFDENHRFERVERI